MKEYYAKEAESVVKSERIIVVPNEIDLRDYRLVKPQKPRCVLFVHHFTPRKGADFLIPIMKCLWSKGVDLPLWVVGSGDYLETFKKESVGLNLKVFGSVPNDKVHELFSHADLLIMPSREEGMHRVLMESMAFGVPFVAHDVGGVKDIIADSAKDYLVQVGDVDCFAETCYTILKDNALKQKLVSDGLKKVREYNTPKVMQVFVKEIMEAHA
jgi:glycosyltransferase involved in cell wall biosynthesis